jgi:hypothetical protein
MQAHSHTPRAPPKACSALKVCSAASSTRQCPGGLTVLPHVNELADAKMCCRDHNPALPSAPQHIRGPITSGVRGLCVHCRVLEACAIQNAPHHHTKGTQAHACNLSPSHPQAVGNAAMARACRCVAPPHTLSFAPRRTKRARPQPSDADDQKSTGARTHAKRLRARTTQSQHRLLQADCSSHVLAHNNQVT